MSDSPPPPAADAPLAAAPVPATPAPAPVGSSNTPLDAHGFDPHDYDWHPVARRKRTDGWTHTRQRSFIEALADTGSVKQAALACDMAIQSCYRLRRSPGAESFARAWDAAIEEASQRLVDIAFDRAVNGVTEPVFDKDGQCIAVRKRTNDRLLMFLLRAHQPQRYRHANADVRHPQEPAPSAAIPVARAIDMLAPPMPAEPHLLLDAETLEDRLELAEIGEGVLPRWLQDGRGDSEVTMAQTSPDFERRLEIAKGHLPGAKPFSTVEEIESRSHLY